MVQPIRRSLFDDEDEPITRRASSFDLPAQVRVTPPKPLPPGAKIVNGVAYGPVRRAQLEESAPWSFPQLLGQMHCVMWDGHHKRWDARARGCEQYAHADEVGAAMQAAIDLRDGKKTRRRLEEE